MPAVAADALAVRTGRRSDRTLELLATMTSRRLILDCMAPIPIGNHVTLHPLEKLRHGRGGTWVPVTTMIVCDDTTRVVYTAAAVGSVSLKYGALSFEEDSWYRLSPELPTTTGTVTACVVRTGQRVGSQLVTVLEVETDPAAYR